jgi:hypothetical protein
MISAGKRNMQESYLFLLIWGELYENYRYRADFYSKLQINKVFKIKFELLWNFEL